MKTRIRADTSCRVLCSSVGAAEVSSGKGLLSLDSSTLTLSINGPAKALLAA